MRAVIQRVTSASVEIEGKINGSIALGLLILLGIEHQDNEHDIYWLINKIVNMRIFNDKEGNMNLSCKDVNGRFLVVSQFTLYASTKKGNRPSFINSAPPSVAIPLYDKFKIELAKESDTKVEAGIFGANMKVNLLNDGPVTIIIDSKNKE